MNKPCKEEHVSHEVIEDQLLVSLSDKSKVAIVLSESELWVLMQALSCDSRTAGSPAASLLKSMNQLMKSAFRREFL